MSIEEIEICKCKSINDGVTKGMHKGCGKPLTKIQGLTQTNKEI